MAFGLTFRNDNNVVALDSEFSRLVVLHSGRYNRGATFPKTITSIEPPLIFVRPDANASFQFVKIRGSPGAWTGWSWTATIVGSSPTGDYFAAAFKSVQTAKFGLRLWDGDSKLLFDNGTPCAQFTRYITSWTFTGSSSTPQGQTRMNWRASIPLSRSGDYMLINNIAMDLAGGDSYSKVYCEWSYTNNQINPFLVNLGDYQRNGLFLTIAFAKPIS